MGRLMVRLADDWTDGQTDRQTGGRTDGWTDKQNGWLTEGQIDQPVFVCFHLARLTDRWIDRQTDCPSD